MKRIIAIIICLAVLAGALSGCSGAAEKDGASAGGDKLSIVCSIFPEYDWVRRIIGEGSEAAELTLLLDTGVDLHSYQPGAGDIVKISSCDVFIYVGGESDVWVEDALKEAANKDMVVIDLMDVLGASVKREELKEGMEDEGEADGQEPEYDEHVWLSVKNAIIFCGYIAGRLEELDPDNADTYAANAEEYIAELTALDGEYRSAVESAKYNAVLFGDRFPFRYLVDDYGLDYYAAFAGCSAETEASFKTIAFLAGKLDELGLPAVMTIEGGKHDIADTIIANTANADQAVLTMDSMQSTTGAQAESGTTYLSIMRANLEALKRALN